jgi:hypothetical protein
MPPGQSDAAPADNPALLTYRELAAAIERDGPAFFAHAELALRIRRAFDDPALSLDQAARLIQAEPLLAARVVGMANSVAYNRSGRPIADARQAVARLGLRTLRALAVSLLVKQLAGPAGDPLRRALAQRLWEHTVHVAALAHVIARRVTHVDPEVALFAGLLHEVAGCYLLAAPAGTAAGDAAPPSWQGEGEALVGRALLAALEVPAEVRAAIEYLWDGYLAIPPASLGDTLLLAEELAPVPSPLYWSPDPETLKLAGAPRIEIALDRETLSGVLAESGEEVASLIDALK